MIKAEVFFETGGLHIGEYLIKFEISNNAYSINTNHAFIKWTNTLEEAINYCLENKE